MKNNIEISITTKQAAGRIPFAAVEIKEGENIKTTIYRCGQKHLNEMFIDLLNLKVLKDLEKNIESYSSVKLNLDKNKFTPLIRDGRALTNEKDPTTIQKTMSLYDRLLSIRNQTDFTVSFEHDNVTHLYNEVLSADNMKNNMEQRMGVVMGDLVVVSEFENNVTPKNNTIKVSPVKNELGRISAFVDVVESDSTKDKFYVGVALSKQTEEGQKTLISKIIPVSHVNKEEALSDQIKKAFFKGETKRQSSYLFNMINKENGLTVYCSPDHKENINSLMSDIFNKEGFELTISDKLGNGIKSKLEKRIAEDTRLSFFDEKTLKEKMAAKEVYQDKFKMAVYVVSSVTDFGQTYGSVVRAPDSDAVIYEIEGKTLADISNDDFHVGKEAIFETLSYVAGKIRNGYIPNNVEIEIRSNNLSLISAMQEKVFDENDFERFNKIKKDLKTNISYAWTSGEHLDPYICCAQDLSKSARKLLKESYLMTVDYENKNILNNFQEDNDYSFSKKRKPTVKPKI